MSDIGKSDFHSFTYLDHMVILTRYQSADRSIRIFHCINRLHQLILCASLRLTILPLCLLHLDMGTVTKHDAAQVNGCLRCKDLPPEPSCV